MARKRRTPRVEPVPPWVLTFTDLSTLLLTFFLLLVAMSVIDVQRQKSVTGSVSGTFGMLPKSKSVIEGKASQPTDAPGPFDNPEEREELQQAPWEDMGEDVRLAENKLVRIISISADVLFQPGQAE